MFKKEKIKDLHYSINGVLTADELQAAADEILTEYGKRQKCRGSVRDAPQTRCTLITMGQFII